MRTKIMERFGWTYQEWQQTPQWVIEETMDALFAESLAHKHERGGQ